MLFVLILYVALCLYGVKFSYANGDDYLSVDNTMSIKGIFILLVFLSHFNSYVDFSNRFDNIYALFISLFGQAMVTMFLFYSGYGVMESIRKKGEVYVVHIPINRVLMTLLKFDCAIFLYFALGLALKEKYTFNQVILSLIGWESLGNSNWYIFIILFLYLLTYVVFNFLKRSNYEKAIVMVLIEIFVILCTAYFNIRPSYWYDTMLCYNLGMLYSLYKDKIEAKINCKNIVWFLTFFICVFLELLMFKYRSNIFVAILFNLVFCLTVILITMKIKFGNRVLVWLGKHLFEIYILQRIPMIVFKHFGLQNISIYLYFVCCFAVTLIMLNPFRCFSNKVCTFLQKK